MEKKYLEIFRTWFVHTDEEVSVQILSLPTKSCSGWQEPLSIYILLGERGSGCLVATKNKRVEHSRNCFIACKIAWPSMHLLGLYTLLFRSYMQYI